MIRIGNHPDLNVLATERVQISIDEIREYIDTSQFEPAVGNYRIMLIEDADRMAERSSNLLLKSLEEPPRGTIWLLCAPSADDMLPTIRSRVRRVMLKVPSVADVAALLTNKFGIEPELATASAAQAQSHVGMARRLATNGEARERRLRSLKVAGNIVSIPDAMRASAAWLDIAKRDADQLTTERDEFERIELLERMGFSSEQALTPAARSQMKKLEEAQKRRATRSLRDGIDRILIDLLGMFRDVISLQISSNSPLTNEDLRPGLTMLAGEFTQAQVLHICDLIDKSRQRINDNVRDSFVLQALAISMRRKAVRR
jgi:DNA polymerase-3 subunit delta'